MATVRHPAIFLADTRRSMLDSLQALRGIAAVMVVVDHAILAVIPYDHQFGPLVNFAGTLGKMGVNLFFVISGFIMMHTTDPIKELPPSQRIANFTWKRVTRLVPLYWLATIIMIALADIQGLRYTIEHILTSFAFLPNFQDTVDPRMTPIVGVGWTITYEVLFYTIFGACLLLPRKIGPVTCIAIIVAMVASGNFLLRHVQDDELRRILFFYSYKNMLFFSVGISIALGLRLLPQIGGQAALGGALTLMVTALTAYWEFRLKDGSLTWQTISFIACTCVVILAVSNRHGSDVPCRRTLLQLGDASFSTYLFHAPIMHFLALLSAPLLTHGHGWLFILTASLICLAAGSLIHSGIELPLTQMVRAGAGRWKRPAQVKSLRF